MQKAYFGGTKLQEEKMIDFQNEVCSKLQLEDFVDIYELLLQENSVELVIVDDLEIMELNKVHRGKDAPTDVLSFPVEFAFANFIGSIVISYETAQKAADEFGHSLQDEAKILFVHGLLHLLGFDHEVDNGEMRQKEQEIAQKLSLPLSLINRNE